jgi:3-hydroxyisobutyrate dehydrogenase-like beta-hydroxyacid dehydrogenase
MERVGVIGLGRMGLPIAANLMEHGFRVIGYRRTGARLKYIANLLLAVHTVAAAESGVSAPVFAAAKDAFDKALADGWGELDIACVHDQVSGVSALEEGEGS